MTERWCYLESKWRRTRRRRRRTHCGGVEWWNRTILVPIRRVWVATSLRFPRTTTGLTKLRKEVRACEYEDVRVMWEMLRKTESEIPVGRRKAPGNAWDGIVEWSRLLNFCRSF